METLAAHSRCFARGPGGSKRWSEALGNSSHVFGLAPETFRSREVVMNKPAPFTIPLFFLCVAAAFLAFTVAESVVLAVVIMLFAILLAASFRMADQWERAVVLRLGRFHSLRGP